MGYKFDKPDGYNSWSGMKQRCTNPKHPKYHQYGGRGITVCKEWDNYLNFSNDMGPRPSSKHSIERVDNSKGYSPANCTWATQTVQCNNRRIRKDNSLKQQGISLHPCGLYYVKLTRSGKIYSSKGLQTLDDAVELRNLVLGELT